MEKTCALIPSYNEARTIGRVVRELNAKGFTVYVVDDGSSDDTALIAEAEGAVVVKHRENKGKGASLREGFKHILKKRFDTVLVMDADGQHKADDIGQFFVAMGSSGADIVIGNRMRDTSSMPIIRILTNRFMSFLISLLSGQRVPDTQCGFRLIKCKVLETVKLKSSNYEIETELIIKAARAHFRITSVPIMTVYENEKSRINPFVDTLRFIVLLIKTVFGR